MARGPLFPTPALSDTDFVQLIAWSHPPPNSAARKRAPNLRGSPARAPLGNSGPLGQLEHVLNLLCLKLLPDGERSWLLQSADAETRVGMSLNDRELELLRHGLALDASWRRELIRLCVEAEPPRQSGALLPAVHHAQVLPVPRRGDALAR
jgi:hypothetical protein